jgi:hypothetical protein
MPRLPAALHRLLLVPEFVVAGLLLALLTFWLPAFPPVSLIPAGRSALSQPKCPCWRCRLPRGRPE